MSVLEFHEVRRAYRKGSDVLHDLTFSVERGQVIGLLGRNGAGKTTLLRVAMGMLAPQHGRVRVFDLDPRARAVEIKRRIGYVSEDQALPSYLTVGQVIDLYRALYPTWDQALAGELAERFQLARREKIGRLSRGQARQVALLCAVSHRPELLLLDEPAGGLDPVARREFLETAIRLLNEAGTTIVFSSHYMSDVERLAERVVMIHDGRLFLDSDLDSLRESFSLALVPPGDGVDRRRLLLVDGCIGVRERDDALHAVFRLPPDGARAAIEQALGARAANCCSIALEEMFIELAGGQS
jgi:ABC-2 type transport system ATP-binding protein